MKKVALVICPPFWLKAPSLGLEYLKNFNRGHEVKIDIYDLNIYFYNLLGVNKRIWLELNREFEGNLYSLIEDRLASHLNEITKKLIQYDFVGFSLFKRNEQFSLALAEKLCKSSSPKLIFGGPQTREINPGKLPPNSIIVEGEGELPLSRIINGNTSSGYYYQELDNLDRLPFLNFEGFDLSLYKPILPLLTSRGCIKRCKFCSEWTLYRKFRQHSAGYMAEQIEKLLKLHKINQFSFQDSLINANLAWLEDFCTKVIKEKLHIKWEAQIIIRQDMDTHLFKLMKEAGCINLFIGLESASDKVLQNMDKGFAVKDAKRVFTNLKNAGLMFEVSIVVGYPRESKEDLKKTIDFLKENKNIIPKIAQVSGFIPYKNSIIFKEKNNGLADIEINRRLRKITNFIEKEKIPHKKAFIDNLRYGSIYADNKSDCRLSERRRTKRRGTNSHSSSFNLKYYI